MANDTALTPLKAMQEATEIIRQARDEFRAQGDRAAAKVADTLLVRVARKLAGRLDDGRRDDGRRDDHVDESEESAA